MTQNRSKKIIIGVSGNKGSFSEEAALVYSKNLGLESKLSYCTDMEGVLKKLSKGNIAIGIFPVVNSRGGLVTQAFSAMGKYRFTLIDQVWLDIQQNLMTLKGVEKKKISSIVSHSQALAQCERYLSMEYPTVPRVEWQDTAKAAQDLKYGLLKKNTAVIAPRNCASMYGLKIIGRSIQDMRPNITTFIVVKK